MPRESLNFVSQLADECRELRQQADENEVSQEKVEEAELRYCDMVDELADHPMFLDAIPDLMGDIDESQYPEFSHIVLRALQDDWRKAWLKRLVEKRSLSIHLQYVGHLPPNIKTDLLRYMLKQPGLLRDWAAHHIVCNDSFSEAYKFTPTLDDCTHPAIAQYAGLSEDCLSLLEELLEESEFSDVQIAAASVLMWHQQSSGLAHLQNQNVIISEESGFGRHLMIFGEESDLRLVQKSIDDLLADSEKNRISEERLSLLIPLFGQLSQFGDTLSAKWLCEKVLLQTNARIRFEAFTALLNLLSDEQAEGGHTLLDEALIKEDALGQYKQLNNKDCERYFTGLFLSVDSDEKLLPPHCHCHNGAPYDQLAELSEALEDLTFGDTLLADQIRMDFAIFSGQHCPLDPYAPYERFIQQRNDLSEAIQRFRTESEYVPGSFKLWR